MYPQKEQKKNFGATRLLDQFSRRRTPNYKKFIIQNSVVDFLCHDGLRHFEDVLLMVFYTCQVGKVHLVVDHASVLGMGHSEVEGHMKVAGDILGHGAMKYGVEVDLKHK